MNSFSISFLELKVQDFLIKIFKSLCIYCLKYRESHNLKTTSGAGLIDKLSLIA